MKLRGQRLLVTGASSGIGYAMAIAFAKEGAVLAVSARRGDRLDQLAKRIESECGGRAIALVADLSRRGEAAELARRAPDDAVAHGATGKGNDQVRFELT